MSSFVKMQRELREVHDIHLAIVAPMLHLLAASSGLVVPSATAGRLAAAPLATFNAPARAGDAVMIAPALRGAVIGGAAVYLADKFVLNKEVKFNEDGSLAPVTKADVTKAQKLWADSIASISKVYTDGGDYVAAAGEAAGKLYGYGKTDVLFKPTKATKNPFRATGESAMSYFVGAEAMNDDKYKGEDAGFAINGGRGWSNVVFNNHKIDLNGPTAQAMGDYVFTDSTSGDEVRVEYTFGYKRNDDGKVRIYLHHSSVPYSA